LKTVYSKSTFYKLKKLNSEKIMLKKINSVIIEDINTIDNKTLREFYKSIILISETGKKQKFDLKKIDFLNKEIQYKMFYVLHKFRKINIISFQEDLILFEFLNFRIDIIDFLEKYIS